MRKLAALSAQDSDKIEILPILPSTNKYAPRWPHLPARQISIFRRNEIVDLLKSYQDVMPEPSDHLELIH